MKELKKYLIIALVALVGSSCGSSLQRKVAIDDVTNFKLLGTSGVKADFVFRNESCHKIKLRDVVVTIKERGKSVAVLELKDDIEIARRTEAETVPTVWRFRDSDPLAIIAGVGRLMLLSKGEGEDVGFKVDIDAEVKAGLFKHDVEQHNLSLGDVMQSLNLTK